MESSLKRNVVVGTQRSPGAAFGGGVAGLTIAGTTILLAIDPALPILVRALTALIGGLLAAALFVSTARLARARGGLIVDADKGVGIGLTSEQDVYWIPADQVLGVGVRYHDLNRDDGSFRTWSAEIICADRPSVVLVEATEREAVDRVVALIESESDLQAIPNDEDADEGDAPPEAADVQQDLADASTFTGIRRRAALADILGMFGGALAAIGIALFAQLASEPMVAVFVAPVLFLLGAAMLGIVVVKRFGGEAVEVKNNLLYHRWQLGPWSWGERFVKAHDVRWRLRVQALKGAYLEAASSDGVLAIGAGATTNSDVNIDALNRLPQALSMSPVPALQSPASD